MLGKRGIEIQQANSKACNAVQTHGPHNVMMSAASGCTPGSFLPEAHTHAHALSGTCAERGTRRQEPAGVARLLARH